MVDFKIIKTKKFKTVGIKVVFYNEFSKENATSLSLLTRVMSNTTKKYNTKKKLIDKLNELYDANVYISSFPSYKTSITTFSLSLINDKYVEEANLMKKGISFLYEIIMNPNAYENSFNIKVFEEEKRRLENEIKKVYNSKSRYALRKMINSMCGDEMLSVSSLGSLEELEKITPESLYKVYYNLITTSKVSIYVIGDVEEDVIRYFNKFKTINSVNCDYETVSDNYVVPSEVNYLSEKQEVKQNKLVMGFRTGCNYKSNDYYVLQIFNIMFGGLFCSNLFMTVREKYSLAYEISSQLIPDSMVMIVAAGVDSVNTKKTIDIVNEELNKYKDGNVDEMLLETAINNAISDLDEIEDSPGQHISHFMKQELLNQYTSVDEIKDFISKITKEDIIKQAKMINLDTVFVLESI